MPHFQPILSIESGRIYGYEILGRIESSEGIESLGPLFAAESPLEDGPDARNMLEDLRRTADRTVRTLAFEQLVQSQDPDLRFFVNIRPSLMLGHVMEGGEQPPFTMRLVESLGIDGRRVVIEITEDKLDRGLDSISGLVEEYRARGCLIAIDDVGVEQSNLDRIGVFHPDIIKIDLSILRRSVRSRNFKEILGTLSHLAQSIGSKLLFEGVETAQELENALSFGAHFIQGHYFAKADADMLPPDIFKSQVESVLADFRHLRRVAIDRRVDWERKIRKGIESLGLDDRLHCDERGCVLDIEDMDDLDGILFRLYVTDPDGEQSSPNYVRQTGGYAADSSAVGKNWCTRPYYAEHLYQTAAYDLPWVVSSLYHDISEDLMLRTFSRNMKDGHILFVDIIADSVGAVT